MSEPFGVLHSPWAALIITGRNIMGQPAKPYPIEARRWISRAEAAGYLGIGLNAFDDKVRPYIREIVAVGDPRFDLEEIDRFMVQAKMGEVAA